jgi:hypothetical protein
MMFFYCILLFVFFSLRRASDYSKNTEGTIELYRIEECIGPDCCWSTPANLITKVRDASKYDRTITMGGDLSDDIRIQVAQVNQPGGLIAQAQVATAVQIQSQPGASTSTPLTTQTLASKTNATAANPNRLEPYGHSVRFIKDVFFRKFSVSFLFRFVLSLVFEMISQVKIQIMFIQFNRINKTQNQVIHRIQKNDLYIVVFSLHCFCALYIFGYVSFFFAYFFV